MSYSLFSGVTAGLLNTYSVLANSSTTGVTLSTISSAMSNSSLATSLNPTFASYIATNFNSLDADRDGVLSSNELSNLTNSIKMSGLTAAQLSQLGPACGISGQTLNQVLEHFADIDTNCDGKVTAAEITAYKLKSAMEKKKTEFANKAATNQSIFYGDDNASSASDSSSMLAFKYWNDGTSNGSGS